MQQYTQRKPQGVKKTILVASGKGGVGKTTIATGIAATLNASGYKVGLLDADVYGPSIASVLGIEIPKLHLEKGVLAPIELHGIKLMSMGFLIKENDALIWRGPMVTKAINKMLFSTAWSNNDEILDYLVIDTPPGTGDAHLTILKNCLIDSSFIVCTKQKLAILDTIKSINMLEKFGLKISSIIENMAYLILEKDNSKNYIFGNASISSHLKKNIKIFEIPILKEICDTNLASFSKYQISNIFNAIIKTL